MKVYYFRVLEYKMKKQILLNFGPSHITHALHESQPERHRFSKCWSFDTWNMVWNMGVIRNNY